VPIKAEEIKLSFNMDDFTWGDLEDINSRDIVKLLDVCGRLATIEDTPQEEVRSVLRQLRRDDIYKIIDLLTEAMRQESNPVDETEKN
jgi:hypothetical protein